jgi:hypothetical protein
VRDRVQARMHRWVFSAVLVTALLGGCTAGGGGGPSADPPPSSAPSSTGAQPASPAPTTAEAPGPSGDAEAPPPADATLVIFLPLGTSGDGGGDGQIEVTDPASIDTLPLPADRLDRVRAAVRPFQRRGLRLFAFTRSGCQHTGAVLSISRAGMLVVLTGGEQVRCFAAEYFLAVFAVPTGKVPPGTRP